MNKGQGMANQSARQFGAMSLLAGALPGNANPCLFDYPFNELLVSIDFKEQCFVRPFT